MAAINRLALCILIIAMSFCALAENMHYKLRIIPLGSPNPERPLATYKYRNFTIAIDRVTFSNEITAFKKQSQIATYRTLLELLESTPAGESIELTESMLPRGQLDLHFLLVDFLEKSHAYVYDDRTGEYLENVQGGQWYLVSSPIGGSGGRIVKTLDDETIIGTLEIEDM